MQRIFFIGYMGAGKTTVGKAFAAQAGLAFIDLDVFIESHHYRTVRQIFEEKGEAAFREIERRALREVAGFEDAVISTGGGTPCFFDNMEFMNATGTTVYLKVSVDELARRVELNKNARPILRDLSGDELRRFIARSLSERTSCYEQARIILDAEHMIADGDIYRQIIGGI
ncbi:MAG: shikimate kinase [Tannerella sp.]|jgi:shikimate kinase|nr:shikimate kinase [Tannerella sp.]